jgi:hypothetical protein
MRRSNLSLLFAVTLALVLAAIPLKASDPVGVYGIIDKVVFEPNETEPTAVQIWGAFSLATPGSSDAAKFGDPASNDSYGAVQTGYMYFTCPAGRNPVCRAEWADLKSVARSDNVFGFGARWAANGRVRAADEKPAAPDTYPLNVGVVKIGVFAGGSANPGRLVTTGVQNRTQYPDLIAALKAAPRRK